MVTPEVTARSRRIGSAPVRIMIVAGIAFLEGYDVVAYGVALPLLLADRSLGVDAAAAGLLGSILGIGMLIGAVAVGSLAPRVSPRRAILANLVLFSLGALLSAVAPTMPVLAAGRFLVGLGLGVVFPLLTAYIADISRPEHRNRNIGLMMGGHSTGALCAPLLGALVLPGASFRWVFLAGVLPLLVVLPLAIRLLPESPVHLLRTGRADEAARTAMALGVPRPDVAEREHGRARHAAGALLAPGVRAVTLLFWTTSFVALILVYGISTWMPTVLAKSGIGLQSALLQTSLLFVGAAVGHVFGGRIADAVGAQRVAAAAFAVAAVSLLGISFLPPVAVLAPLLFACGLGLGSTGLTNAFVVTRYPDALRARGISYAVAAGRLGAIVGPLLGAWVLASALPPEMTLYCFAVPGIVAMIAVLAVRRS